MADSLLVPLGRLLAKVMGSRWTVRIARVVGSGLYIFYLARADSWQLSIAWALAYVAIGLTVSFAFVPVSHSNRFPGLSHYLLQDFPQATYSGPRLHRWDYLVSQPRAFFFSIPAEDGLVCVPLLMIGVNPVNACLAGAVFGLKHLAGYTYLECIAKFVYYAAACLIVLPHGLLTMTAGHLIGDAMVFAVLKVAQNSANARAAFGMPPKK